MSNPDSPTWNYKVSYVDPLRTENTHLKSGKETMPLPLLD